MAYLKEINLRFCCQVCCTDGSIYYCYSSKRRIEAGRWGSLLWGICLKTLYQSWTRASRGNLHRLCSRFGQVHRVGNMRGLFTCRDAIYRVLHVNKPATRGRDKSRPYKWIQP